eukprot:s235_g27.t1
MNLLCVAVPPLGAAGVPSKTEVETDGQGQWSSKANLGLLGVCFWRGGILPTEECPSCSETSASGGDVTSELQLTRRGIPDSLWIRVKGKGFLKHMVRRIVGLLVEVGLGTRHCWRHFEALPLDQRPPKAPAQGLWLEEVETWSVGVPAVVGKLGFICVLGFLYVPDYGGDEMGCSQRLDFWFLGILAFFLGWGAKSLKLNVPRSVRLQLFLASVRGPFLTSGLFGIFKKTLLPTLGMLLMAILYCDLYARDAGAAASLGSVPRLHGSDDATAWWRALREGQRRPFDPLKESVELLMHFLWVSCFVAARRDLGLCQSGAGAAFRRPEAPGCAAAAVATPGFGREGVGSILRQMDRPLSRSSAYCHRAGSQTPELVMNVLVLLLPFALAASDCGGALIVENPCTLKTVLIAVLAILGLEVYWSLLAKFLRCTWRRLGFARPAAWNGDERCAVPPTVPGAGDFSPEILPTAATKTVKTNRSAADC